MASFANPTAKLAYMVRAVAPGTYVHPGATVEDMYRPEWNARRHRAPSSSPAPEMMPAERPSWPRRLCGGLLGLALLAGAVGLILTEKIKRLGPPPLGDAISYSTLVVDRNGKLLRPFLTKEGYWRLPASSGDVDPRFLRMLIGYEDKRFFAHRGVDPLALARAAWQALSNGRVVSGGSTLTMQVARLLEPRPNRSIGDKFAELIRAIQIERRLTKHEILDLYLALAPYGGNIEGVRAASLAYFGKEPKRLSTAEAALLVAIPQAPEQRRPDRRAAAGESGA